MKFQKCKCGGKCFARENGKCTILTKTPDNKCSFQKPKRNVTNGNVYDFGRMD